MTSSCITARFLLAMSSYFRGLDVSSQTVEIQKTDPSSVRSICITSRFLLAMTSYCRGLDVSSQTVESRKADSSSVKDVHCTDCSFSDMAPPSVSSDHFPCDMDIIICV